MKNYGIASPKVTMLNTLPNIQPAKTKYNLDIGASAYNIYANSQVMPPVLVEYATDTLGMFNVVFPARRTTNVDNYLISDKSPKVTAPDPYLTFKETDVQDGIVKDMLKKFLSHDKDMQKPQWENRPESYVTPPNDVEALADWWAWLGQTKPTVPASTSIETKKIMWLHQTKVLQGLWWAVESNAFLKDQTPFWVQIQRQLPPSTSDYESFFIISLNLGTPDERMDLYITNRARPRIIDYWDTKTTGTPNVQMEFNNDLARIMETEPNLNISFQTVAGRLLVFVNNIAMSYTRVIKEDGDDNGKIKDVVLRAGAIRIYGTNVQCKINVNPMTFAGLAAFAVPVAKTTTSTGGTPGGTSATYQGVENDGTLRGSVAELPTDPDSKEKLFGVDCKDFTGAGGSASPKGLGFHQKGRIHLDTAKALGVTGATNDFDPFVVALLPEDQEWISGSGTTYSQQFGGAPYFFRVKGMAVVVDKSAAPAGTVPADATPYLINMSETQTAPDYFHVKKSATITLYNEGGIFDGLRDFQYGVQIEWGWGTSTKKTFTGLIISVSTSEVAGKETITLQCEDYIYLLKNTYILNSPFYDGMIGVYAIKDMVERAGIDSLTNKWENEKEYFMPSGYSFSNPLVRYPWSHKIFDCVMDVVKRFQAFIYFDADGKFVVERLKGGLFSVTGKGSAVCNFITDPKDTSGSKAKVILDEKKIDYNFDSTVNQIVIFSVDRNTRNTLVYGHAAPAAQNVLMFKKVYQYNQAAFGSMEVIKAWANDLGERMFYPIRKSGFKVVGDNSIILAPLDFITLCGLEYRVTTATRRFNADNNDFQQEYNVEWLAGK